PRAKSLYNKKVMHKDAVALVKHVLTCLKYQTQDEKQQENYFTDSSVLDTAIRFGTTEF
ncbi:hypothetical protein MKW94_001063, partial [Papaver nudicaule]|nr:hypothetical protein [Papaver nudicaule]